MLWHDTDPVQVVTDHYDQFKHLYIQIYYVAFNTCIVEKECTDADFLTNVDEVEGNNGRGEESSKLIFTEKMCFPSCFKNVIQQYIKQTL